MVSFSPQFGSLFMARKTYTEQFKRDAGVSQLRVFYAFRVRSVILANSNSARSTIRCRIASKARARSF